METETGGRKDRKMNVVSQLFSLGAVRRGIKRGKRGIDLVHLRVNFFKFQRAPFLHY
jgi:hypothetical protein